MRWIIGSSLKARRFVVAAAVVVMAFGVWQLRDAKVETLPEFTPPTVRVQTDALGLSAEEVEQLITVPLEQDLLDGVAWLDTIRSKSVPGLSSIDLVFKPGTNLYRARQVVQERISQAAGLPNVSRPPQMVQPESSVSRTAMIGLSSKSLTPLQVGVLARWTIRPRLLAVAGVANVAIWGQRERQLQVQVDPQKLRDKHVTLEEVVSTAGNALWVSQLTFLEASTPGTGGFIDTPNQRLGIQHNLPIIEAADLAEISVRKTSGASLTLGDVATVVEDHQPLIGDAVVRAGDNDNGFLLAIDKLPNANTADVTKGVEEALDELRPGLSGVTMDSSVFRPSNYVDRSVHNLTRSALVGMILMLLVLAWFLFNWRAALTAVVAIALSLTAAALVLHALGQTFNAFVLAGLVVALAAVIDDGVVTVENVARRLEPGDTHDEERSARRVAVALEASLESARTAVWATVVFGIALVPIFFMNGLSGDAFFPPVARACAVALVVSLLVSMTVTPALSVLLFSAAPTGREAPPVRWIRQGYTRVFGWLVRAWVPALAVIAVVVVVGAAGVSRFDKSLLPPLRDTNLLVHWQAQFGTSLPEMDRVIRRASEELRSVRGVRNVAAQIGQAVLGDQAVGSDSAEMWVSVDPEADYDNTVAAVRRVVDGYPGIRHEVSTYSKDKLDATLGRTSDEITVRVFGENLGVLDSKAREVKKLLEGIGGTGAVRVSSRTAEPTIEVSVDLAKAEVAGIKPGDVRRAAAVMVSGLRVGNLFQDQKIFDVVVWSAPETRQSVSTVRNLLINTPSGEFVRLGDVADVEVRPTLPVIEHEDISRFVDVTANVSGRGVDDVTRNVRSGLARIKFPLEYHAELLGDYSQQQSSQSRLLGFAIAAGIGLLLLLQAAFGSWRLAIISFATLPVAVAGGVLAAWGYGGPMTLATVAGLLAVLAVAVRSNVMLMHRYLQLRTEGVPFGSELVARGAQDRLGPTVRTAVITASLLLPAVAFGHVAGQEILYPMAVVMLGGLVTAAFATLAVLPALYARFAARAEPEPWVLDAELDLIEEKPPLAVTIAGD